MQFPVVNVPGATGNTGMTKMLQSRPGETAAIMPADTLATVVAGTSSFKLDEIKPVCRISQRAVEPVGQHQGQVQDVGRR